MTADDWPDRMIDQRPENKIRWLLTDSRRYMEQCRAEESVEARAEVKAELNRRAAARAGGATTNGLWRPLQPGDAVCRPCARIGAPHHRPPKWWQRVLHWMGYWP